MHTLTCLFLHRSQALVDGTPGIILGKNAQFTNPQYALGWRNQPSKSAEKKKKKSQRRKQVKKAQEHKQFGSLAT